MAVTQSYREYVLDQLARLPGLTCRRMFSGLGLYADARFFAIVHEDTLYLRVNDETRPEFLAREMAPFRPMKRKPEWTSENYFQCPAEVLDDSDELTVWAKRALRAAATPTAGAARRKRAAKSAATSKPRRTTKTRVAPTKRKTR